MTPEAQRVAIAGACGTLKCPGCSWERLECSEHDHKVPDYPNDLAAMNIVEKVLDERNLWDVYERELEAIWRSNEQGRLQQFKIHASSKVRCEAMIKTLELWKD